MPEEFLKIAQLGQPLLRQRSLPVTDIASDRALQDLSDRLLEATRAADGVGLAAPQLGVLLRVVAIASRPCYRPVSSSTRACSGPQPLASRTGKAA